MGAGSMSVGHQGTTTRVVAHLVVTVVALGATAVAWVVGLHAVHTASGALHAATPLEPVRWLALAGLALSCAWLAGAFALEAATGLPGLLGRAAGSVRRALGPWGGGALVAAVVGFATAPAQAHAESPADPLDLPAVTAPADSAASPPDASGPPDTHPPADTGPSSGEHASSPSRVRVEPGDTLWGIAARHLGPEATDAEVAEAWPRWYEANRDRIGEDPDLVLPGTVLTPPNREETQR